jgi:hypothetical protein
MAPRERDAQATMANQGTRGKMPTRPKSLNES